MDECTKNLLMCADRMFDEIQRLIASKSLNELEYVLGSVENAARLYNEACGSDDVLPGRTGSNFIFSFSGRRVWPLNMEPSSLSIQDIAHSLSNLCRFTGHSRHFYSVAQHCVLASEWCPPADAKWCLLHDAAEAYIGDVAKPVKQCLPLLKAAETRILRLLAAKFCLPWPMPQSVHDVDSRMLATERRDVFLVSHTQVLPQERREPFPDTIDAVEPLTAEAMFLARFYDLFGPDD